MDDDETELTSDDAAPDDGTGDSGEQNFSRADLNAQLAKERRNDRAKIAELQESLATLQKPPTNGKGKRPAKAEVADEMAALSARLEASELKSDFAEYAADFGWTKAQRTKACELYVKVKPENGAEWLEDFSKAFSVTPATPTAVTDPAKVVPVPPASSPIDVAPIPQSAFDRLQVHPNSLTADMCNRMGPVKLTNYVTNWFRENG